MGDESSNTILSGSCTYAPTYGRCDAGVTAKVDGGRDLVFDASGHHEVSFDGNGIPTTGMDLSLTARKWFLNAMVGHVSAKQYMLHSQSGATEFGLGGGWRTSKSFKKFFSIDHLVAGGVVVQDQPVGNLNSVRGEPLSDGSSLFFWPIVRAEQTISFKRKWLSAHINHGINLFAQLRKEFMKTDTNSFLPDWHLNAEVSFRPSHWWKKKMPLDMEVVLGARYFSGYIFDGFGENADIHAGVNIGQRLKKFRWSLSTKYTQPIRRDLHAADALPVGRLQSLKTDGLVVWEPAPKHSLLLSLGFATHFKDNDEMWFVAPPMKDYVHAGVGYQYGPASIFARVMAMSGSPKTDVIATLGASFNFDFFNGKSVPIERLQPALPRQHLPLNARVGIGRHNYGLMYGIGTKSVEGDSPTSAQLGSYLRELINNFVQTKQPKRDNSTGIPVQDSNGNWLIFEYDKLFKEIDGILNKNVSGKKKAELLVNLGKQQKTEVEKFAIITYVIGQYTIYNNDRRDGPLDTKNWNTWDLAKVLDQNNRVCRDAANAVYEFLKKVVISTNRLKMANVTITHRVLFYQFKGGPNDGYWIVFDQNFLLGPIKTKNLKQAMAWYTPTSYGRGWLEPGKGPFGTNRYKMGFTGQWQRMRTAARKLVTPRR